MPCQRPQSACGAGAPCLTLFMVHCSVRTWACTAADIQCVEQLAGHRQAVHCVAWGAEPSTLLSGSQAGLRPALHPVMGTH